ncbi:MAG: YdeI/OmpD-associated family protein [Proteobacteria bacterium]|nr:YdeI/OmpD-associated family protein [Pseudomonadota bacterium]
MDPVACPTPSDFRTWLEANHATADAVLVLLYKTGSGRPSITWPQAIEEALCFGWIDGVRQPIDADSYTVRFTPRRKGSKWSQVNIASVARLREQGRMAPAGEKAFEARVEGPPRAYSPKDTMREFSPEHAAALAADPVAQAFWDKGAPSWRHRAAWWVTSAKAQATRDTRMAKLIAACAGGRKFM